jgi:hypothetical protein
MVQTSDGAANNPWVVYMKACAAAYKAERAQQQGAAEASKVHPIKSSTPKRRTKKKTKVTAHLAYPGDRDEVLLDENVANLEPGK